MLIKTWLLIFLVVSGYGLACKYRIISQMVLTEMWSDQKWSETT